MKTVCVSLNPSYSFRSYLSQITGIKGREFFANVSIPLIASGLIYLYPLKPS